MRKILFTILFTLLAVMPMAAQQKLKFGYLSYETVMRSMPEYAEMQSNMADLRQKYEAEQKRVELDFNKKYEEFLDGQKSFPKNILQKRQSELQEMLDKSVAFKQESQRLLADAENSMLASIRTIVAQAVEKIGKERDYAFILDMDSNANTWINPAMGEDITEAVTLLVK